MAVWNSVAWENHNIVHLSMDIEPVSTFMLTEN